MTNVLAQNSQTARPQSAEATGERAARIVPGWAPDASCRGPRAVSRCRSPQFALHDAQLVVARAYGFESWPKLKAFVERMTVHRLVDAIRARDTATVQQLLARRPELVRMSIDNLHVLHYAVLADTPDVVRLLMAHGANAREGVYPYREATTAHALAVQRGPRRDCPGHRAGGARAEERASGARTHPRPTICFARLPPGTPIVRWRS